ncbi:MAG: flagellar protein export ATPase FliI [Deltaproteobacteria bacterium]|nr:flagellar protein export ATPase FliI [Deltaproteobacteria bacterium]
MTSILFESVPSIDFTPYHRALENLPPVMIQGKVTRVVGLVIEGHGPGASIGSLCRIYPQEGSASIMAEVVGFKDERILLMPLGEVHGIRPGSTIVTDRERSTTKVGKGLLGRVINGLGDPLDGKGPLKGDAEYPLFAEPIPPLKRAPIRNSIHLGIRAVDALLTCGKGQRLGIFSGSGVGKSMLLGMIARNTEADVSIIALIGERGREVGEFISESLGEDGLKRSVVIAATSDQPPLVRLRGAYIAMAIAEYYRDMGKHVVLMMDSITRFAMAQREIGLAIGEPPTTKGYTPSVFAVIPKLVERAGPLIKGGSITGLYTVLVENDDLNDPIADALRSVLDGHIVLSRELANQNHYPAIDCLNSISRVMRNVISKDHWEKSRELLEILAQYKKAEDMIMIGAYVSGSNPKVDRAIEMNDKIQSFLRQGIDEKVNFQDSLSALLDVMDHKG